MPGWSAAALRVDRTGSVGLAACASLPEDYPRSESTAFTDYPSTTLGQIFTAPAGTPPEDSGFVLNAEGRRAFTARIALIDLADESIDLQYFIWEPDSTGRLLAERLLRAADRGVRVRALIDDIQVDGRDQLFAAFSAHPNIELRLFNPCANRNTLVFDYLFDMGRVNQRMHNKAFVVDNAVAIIGGRNVGDIYFQVATDHNYRDLDIAAVGPVVREISDVFDYFWNGDWSVPVEALVEESPTADDLEAVRGTIAQFVADARATYPYPLEQDVELRKGQLEAIKPELIWAPGRIVWNDPAELGADGEEGAIMRALVRKLDTIDEQLLIESAHFVAPRGAERVAKLQERGVRVRILTNSLASNDVIAAHAGHAKYRKALLESGAEIYEVRADSGEIKQKVAISESRAALHTKAVAFDHDAIFVGSFNLDPRSANINTEAGLYVESPELAAELIAFMDEGVSPENSYRVELDRTGELVWITEEDGSVVRLTEEPGNTFSRQFMTDLIIALPVEDQL